MSAYSTQQHSSFLGYSVAAKGEDRHDGDGYQEEEGVARDGWLKVGLQPSLATPSSSW